MLKKLSIHGFALIESCELELQRGLNVLTGETGVGKSIVIKALGLVVGNQAPPDAVRHGFAQCHITAQFILADGEREAITQLLELEPSRHNVVRSAETCIELKRVLYAHQRSQCFFQGKRVTRRFQQKVGLLLLDIFGQHQNQKLMLPEYHASFIDALIKPSSVLENVVAAYRTWQTVYHQLLSYLHSVGEKAIHADLWQFQIQNLSKLDPSESDYQALRLELDQFKKELRWRDPLTQIAQLLDSDESGYQLRQATDKIKSAVRQIVARSSQNNSETECPPWVTQLERHTEQVEQGLSALFATVQDFPAATVSQKRADEIQERLFQYHDALRTFRLKSAAELASHHHDLKAALASLEGHESQCRTLCQELQSSLDALRKSTQILSEQRRLKAAELEQRVAVELATLGIPDAHFQIRLEPTPHLPSSALAGHPALPQCLRDEMKAHEEWARQLSESGAERMEFYFSANPGEPLKRLTSIASGGELSRILLAIQSTLASGQTYVLVFDEVDAGVSGRIADQVGRKLKHLGQKNQVLCVTHLPQVAVYADHHLYAEKHVTGGRTRTRFRTLSQPERRHEIARLVSGSRVARSGLQHANTLLHRVNKASRNVRP